MAKPPGEPPTGSWRYRPGAGILYRSLDDQFTARLSGLLQVDAALFNADRRPLHDDAEVRRGRLSVSGSLYEQWTYRAEADFADADPRLIEAYVRRRKFAGGSVTLGYIKEPISLESQSSSRTSTFMERGLLNTLLHPYHVGGRADWSGANWSAAAGVFGGSIYREVPDDGDWGVTARATYAPIHRARRVLHLGLGAAYREAEGHDGVIDFSPRPEAHLSEIEFVDTRNIRGVDDHRLAGVELASVAGPWSIQGEYLRAFLQRPGRRDNLQFDGWYLYGSWILTGESRRYDVRRGRFRGVEPRRPAGRAGGVGAWELAARYSTLDLNDERIFGGVEDNLTLALNWYPTSALRVMANVIFVATDENSQGRRNRGEEHPEIFQLRGQIEF